MTAIDHTPRSEIRLGLRVAALFFIGLLGGAAMVPLDSGVYAHGTVMVSGKRQAVQNRDGGVVTARKVGQTVFYSLNAEHLPVLQPLLARLITTEPAQ